MHRSTAEDLDRAITPGPWRDTGPFSSHTDGPLAEQGARHAATVAAIHSTVWVTADGRSVNDVIVSDSARNYGKRAETLRDWNARHATGGRRFMPAGIPNNVYVPDKSSAYGYRRTNILAVTVPHDCENHLV